MVALSSHSGSVHYDRSVVVRKQHERENSRAQAGVCCKSSVTCLSISWALSLSPASMYTLWLASLEYVLFMGYLQSGSGHMCHK